MNFISITVNPEELQSVRLFWICTGITDLNFAFRINFELEKGFPYSVCHGHSVLRPALYGNMHSTRRLRKSHIAYVGIRPVVWIYTVRQK